MATDKQRFVYIQTFGCQMNLYDTDRMLQVLRPAGYEPTEDPSLADLILLNTCSVREKAEHKMMSALGSYRRLKEFNDDLVLGVGGCVATQEGERLLRRVPYLDIVFGPDNVGQLPALVRRARDSRERASDTAFWKREDYEWIPVEPQPGLGVSAMLTVMKGCNKFCSFCIVPFTRGREVSKPAELVVEETRRLVAHGVREIMLLGQNVNSYGRDRRGAERFPRLLEMVGEVEGLERIRFTTSHPWDCTDELVACFDGHVPRLCEYLHLPVQSGSDDVLKKMRRGYTVASYMERMERLRQTCPGIALSTDIIVGFPGETDEQFQETVRLLEEVRFDRIFSFAYSERPGTAASRLSDDVPAGVKAARLHEVQDVQARISAERMRAYQGRTVEVLVEGPSKSAVATEGCTPIYQLTGRTRTNFVVNFPARGPALGSVGRLVDVRVDRVLPHSLFGEATAVEASAA